MKTKLQVVSLVAAALIPIGAASAVDNQGAKAQPAARTVNHNAVNKLLGAWPAGPRLAGEQMMAKYGAPQEATSERLVWHNAGPYLRILLTRKELPHNFPITHMDYLEHTIAYNVPVDKTDEVHALDASISIYRVGGELSARCDLESNNVLTLNLAHDVATGKKTVEEARKAFGHIVVDRTLGKDVPYAMALQFEPATVQAAADPEKTTIPGAPQRAGQDSPASAPGKASSDAEIMAMLVVLDENEVGAAMTAQQKKLSQPLLDYAKTLHQQHGKNMQDTLQLGMKIGVTPLETKATEALHIKGAQALAKLVPLNGEDFGRAYLAQMIKAHTDALQMVDQQIRAAQNEDLKAHLTATREELAMHLKAGDQLQAARAGQPRR